MMIKVINNFFVDEMRLTIVAILLALFFVTMNIRESFTAQDKKTCLAMANKSKWKKYYWQPRFGSFDGTWECPSGWEDTKCNWGMGKEFEKRQCRSGNKFEGGNGCFVDLDCPRGQECEIGWGAALHKCVPRTTYSFQKPSYGVSK